MNGGLFYSALVLFEGGAWDKVTFEVPWSLFLRLHDDQIANVAVYAIVMYFRDRAPAERVAHVLEVRKFTGEPDDVQGRPLELRFPQ